MRPLPAIALLAILTLLAVPAAQALTPAANATATPPLVEIKPCSGGTEGIYVAGRLILCFRDHIIPQGIVEVRDCPGPTQPGVGIYVLGRELACIDPA